MSEAGGENLVANVIVDSGSGYAQTIRAGHHRLSADEPTTNGGADRGPAPYCLLLAALGACTSITLQMYAARKGWDLGAVQVVVRMVREGGVERIERDLRFGAPLTDEQRVRLSEIAEKTPVTRTLRAGVAITPG